MTEHHTRAHHRSATSAEELAQLTQEHARELTRRAEAAGRSVVRLFGRKALGLPGTLIGAVQIPETRGLKTRLTDWHYWWQAHFLDCAIDASAREHSLHNSAGATEWYETGTRILAGIKARNFNSFTNSYYDDMAWLALAAGRLNTLSHLLRGRGNSSAQDAGTTLFIALAQAATQDLGGGMFWSSKRDFKNTPATAPAALAFARAHQPGRAANLLNWLHRNLWDGEKKAYLDGIKIKDGGRQLERGLFTYNQGPVLSALLETLEAGGKLDFDAAAHIDTVLEGIDSRFCADYELSAAETLRVLKTQGSGDGGLFTGILARYLAQVALSEKVSSTTRERAATLVLHTAEMLWEGRREFDPDLPLNEAGINVNEIRGEAAVLFSTDPLKHSAQTLVPGRPVELSTQLQAWMILEAAARIALASPHQ